MASIKLTTRLKLLSPFVDEKVFRNLQKRLEGVSVPQKTTKVLDHLKGGSTRLSMLTFLKVPQL